MKIGIATDHRGVKAKQELTNFLISNGYNVIDYGVNSEDSVDYPKYAFAIGEDVLKGLINYGILICGTGIGMSIACNKVKGVRCAKVDNQEEAFLAKSHNNANVITIGNNNTQTKEIVLKFLTTEFSNEDRHIRRNKMIDEY